MIKQVKAPCSAQSCTSSITMVLTLPLGYPDIPPKISLSTRDCNNEILIEMKEDVENHAQLLLGQPMLMNLIMKLEEFVSSCMFSSKISCSSCVKTLQKSQEVGTVSDRATEESACWTTVLQIDHMRSKSSYIKTLTQWTKELDLCGHLVFYDRLILLLLQGDLKDIKVFISHLRTVNVDVDSRGRSCKERMLKILAEPQLLSNPRCPRFTTFSMVTLTSWKAVEELFHEHGLEKLYFDHVTTLKSR